MKNIGLIRYWLKMLVFLTVSLFAIESQAYGLSIGSQRAFNTDAILGYLRSLDPNMRGKVIVGIKLKYACMGYDCDKNWRLYLVATPISDEWNHPKMILPSIC